MVSGQQGLKEKKETGKASYGGRGTEQEKEEKVTKRKAYFSLSRSFDFGQKPLSREWRMILLSFLQNISLVSFYIHCSKKKALNAVVPFCFLLGGGIENFLDFSDNLPRQAFLPR